MHQASKYCGAISVGHASDMFDDCPRPYAYSYPYRPSLRPRFAVMNVELSMSERIPPDSVLSL
jgi:hypothetical protein